MAKKFLIRSIQDVKQAIQENNYVLYGLSGNPNTRSEIWPLVPEMELVCSRRTGEYDAVGEKIQLACFDREGSPVRYTMTKTEKIVSDPVVVSHISQSGRGKNVGIYIYKSTSLIEKTCQENGWTLIANREETFNQLNNRQVLFDILEKIGHPNSLQSTRITLDELESREYELVERFGGRLVLQLFDQGGGRGTFLFKDDGPKEINKTVRERLAEIEVEGNVDLLCNRYVDGPAMSITGCITRDNGILTSYAQYQLIDIKETLVHKTDAQGVFCGHDWSLSNDIPLSVHQEAQRLAEAIGQVLKDQGALGIFGLDFIWDKENDQVVPLEINPRLLGTFPTAVQVQLAVGEVPLVAFHLLDFLSIPYQIENEHVFSREPERVGAHLLVFNPYPNDVLCQEDVKGGVYRISDGKMQFVRLGFELADITEPGEFILTDGVPVKNLVIRENRKLLKIITRDTIAKNGGKELNPFGQTILQATLNHLNLAKYEKG